MSENRIIVHIPATEQSVVNDLLRIITRTLVDAGHPYFPGAFGGFDGYGVNYEDDLFMMHPYCWCWKTDCLWCQECFCTYRYFVDKEEVDVDRYMEVFLNSCEQVSDPVDRKKERARRGMKIETDRLCRWHEDPVDPLPNFHHKPSDLKIWWYKWIGRGIELKNPNSVDVEKVLSDCLGSLEQS